MFSSSDSTISPNMIFFSVVETFLFTFTGEYVNILVFVEKMFQQLKTVKIGEIWDWLLDEQPKVHQAT